MTAQQKQALKHLKASDNLHSLALFLDDYKEKYYTGIKQVVINDKPGFHIVIGGYDKGYHIEAYSLDKVYRDVTSAAINTLYSLAKEDTFLKEIMYWQIQEINKILDVILMLTDENF